MKKILLLLALLLALTGCVRQEPPAPEPEPVPEPAPIVTPAPVEPEPAPEPEPTPEEPPIAEPRFPDLPYPAYCWGDTAVSSDGTVILQVPDHTLELVFDAVSGKPAGFLAQPAQISMILYTAFYGLDGQPILTDTPLAGFHTTGNLCWYFADSGYTLLRLSDGTVVAEGLKTVEPAGDVLIMQSNFWNSPCVLVDRMTGETVRELDRGFTLSRVYRDGSSLYLAMESTVDGKVTLIDLQGQPRLDDFHDAILSVTQGCAVVYDSENGTRTYSAVDLETGTVLFRRNQPFHLLPDSILANLDVGAQLLDRQGQPLNEKIFGIAYPCDADSDGDSDLILGSPLKDSDTTIVMLPDGTELASIPTSERYVSPITPTQIIYCVFTGADALQQEVHLLDLDKGTDMLLVTDSSFTMQPITTSGGQMLLCTTEEGTRLFLNDGTPARDDLGPCTYLGGDVFACDEGLRCLDGSWLYRPE